VEEKPLFPSSRLSQFDYVAMNAYWLNVRLKYFTDPLLYALATGIWVINLMDDIDIAETGTQKNFEYGLVYIYSNSRIDTLFIVALTHYFNVKREKEYYRSIPMDALQSVMKSLIDFMNDKLKILDKLKEKLDERVILMMWNQLYIFVMGFLYGLYGRDAEAVFSGIVARHLLPFGVLETIRRYAKK